MYYNALCLKITRNIVLLNYKITDVEEYNTVQVGWVASCRLRSGCWEPQAMRSDKSSTLCTTKGTWGHEGQLGNWTARGTPGAQDSKSQTMTGLDYESIKAQGFFCFRSFLGQQL